MSRPKYHLEEVFDPTRAHPAEAHSLLMRLVPPASRVLELGCASGYLSGYMQATLGCRVTGLEADPAAATIAAQRCQEVYEVDLDDPAGLAPARPSAPYDVLLAAAVLEHLKYPERLLGEARSLLAPGARVIVSLPNIAHWTLRLRLLAGRFDYTDYGVMDRTHLRFYTLKTGRKLLEAQGYCIEQFYIAGSALQNILNSFARRFSRPPLPPLLPGLLGYEMIFLARKPAVPGGESAVLTKGHTAHVG